MGPLTADLGCIDYGNQRLRHYLMYVLLTMKSSPIDIYTSSVAGISGRGKGKKYLAAVETRQASCTPFVVSIDGVMGREASSVCSRISEVLSVRMPRPYSHIMGWLRVSLSFSITRATGQCLRGSRMKWRTSYTLEDGVGLHCKWNSQPHEHKSFLMYLILGHYPWWLFVLYLLIGPFIKL